MDGSVSQFRLVLLLTSMISWHRPFDRCLGKRMGLQGRGKILDRSRKGVGMLICGYICLRYPRWAPNARSHSMACEKEKEQKIGRKEVLPTLPKCEQ